MSQERLILVLVCVFHAALVFNISGFSHSSMHVTVPDLLIYKEAVGLSILLCQTPACLSGL